MRYVLLFSLFLVGCNSDYQFYKNKSLSCIDLNKKIEELERDNENLKNKIVIALDVNTCWKVSGTETYYKLGIYNKEKDNYAALDVFYLTTREDVNGKEFKTWEVTEYTSVEDVKRKSFKVKCSEIKAK